MRKLLIIALIFSLLLAGCGTAKPTPTTAPVKTTILLGYAEEDITPLVPVPLQGYGRVQDRYSNNVLSPLMATAIAVSDEAGETVLIISVDLCNSSTASKYRSDISLATGVPMDHIFICATHTHSAPSTGSTNLPGIRVYNSMLQKKLVQVAQAAMEDRQEADIFGATVETTGLNFVRRYVLKDGTFGGDNYGDFSVGIEGHESEVDNTMQLVKFVREGKSDVILTNFQTHPHRTGGSKKYNVSADIVGAYRDAMAESLGAKVVYITGGSGNVNPTSRIPEENIYPDYLTHGQAMAQAAMEAQYTPLSGGKVQVATQKVVVKINHTNDQYAAILKEYHNLWNNGELTTAEFNKIANEVVPIKINSPYHANAIYNNSRRAQGESFTIYALSFGDVAFIGAPYEMFDHNGVEIKDNSPFAMTIIGTCTNGAMGYLPSYLGFRNGGYSVDTTRYERGTAEQMVRNYGHMLKELYENR